MFQKWEHHPEYGSGIKRNGGGEYHDGSWAEALVKEGGIDLDLSELPIVWQFEFD